MLEECRKFNKFPCYTCFNIIIVNDSSVRTVQMGKLWTFYNEPSLLKVKPRFSFEFSEFQYKVKNLTLSIKMIMFQFIFSYFHFNQKNLTLFIGVYTGCPKKMVRCFKFTPTTLHQKKWCNVSNNENNIAQFFWDTLYNI